MPVARYDAATRDELRRRIRALTPESGRQWGRMDPHQAVCHLCDAFLMALGERDVGLRLDPFRGWLLRIYAFNTPLPWPKNGPTAPGLDQRRRGTQPTEFAADRARLEALLTRFWDAERHDAPHVFGRLSEREWRVWAERHTDHHLRQFGV
ncbi:MAG: hypothetical protein WEB88_05155 [Gemmatimonadota bacterium]